MTAPMPQGSTPNAGLPYPESTDDLNQGANAIKALALGVDVQVPVQRIWFRGDGTWAATNSSGVIATGLTRVDGAIVTSRSNDRVLITTNGYSGANINVRVFLNEGNFTGNFVASVLAWGA